MLQRKGWGKCLNYNLLEALLIEATDKGIVDALKDGTILLRLLGSEGKSHFFDVVVK
jgi:hypothetical protein